MKQYVAWKPDPNSIRTNAMQQRWNLSLGYALPPFCLVSQIIANVDQGKSGSSDNSILNVVCSTLLCPTALQHKALSCCHRSKVFL